MNKSLRKVLTIASCAILSGSVIAPDAASAAPFFRQTNLVASQPNLATTTDPDLINPWGAVPGTGGFFWVADNGTGKATLYSPSGVKNDLVVTLPNATGADPSAPTGQVLNLNPANFLGDSFIFATEEGTIIGWQAGTSGQVRSDQSASSAIYKGLELATSGGQSFLYAADFHNGKIDVFDSSYALVPAASPDRFVDPNLPDGFAPFNIHRIGSRFYVTYARQDADAEDDVAGTGNGLISVFRPDGSFVRRFLTGSAAGGRVRQLNSPWGLATGIRSFGPLRGTILVGNFGSGRIAAFNTNGRFISYVSSRTKRPIRIEGLWEIFYGTNQTGNPRRLYFTAGPDDESQGLFGFLSVTGPGTQTVPSRRTPTPVQNGRTPTPASDIPPVTPASTPTAISPTATAVPTATPYPGF